MGHPLDVANGFADFFALLQKQFCCVPLSVSLYSIRPDSVTPMLRSAARQILLQPSRHGAQVHYSFTVEPMHWHDGYGFENLDFLSNIKITKNVFSVQVSFSSITFAKQII